MRRVCEDCKKMKRVYAGSKKKKLYLCFSCYNFLFSEGNETAIITRPIEKWEIQGVLDKVNESWDKF